MADIVFACAKCTKPTNDKLSANGVCRDCVIEQLMAPDRQQYVGLLAKRARYARHGQVSNSKSLFRVERRVIGKLLTYAPWWSQEDRTKWLNECRMEAESLTRGGKRIYLAKESDVAPLVEATKTILTGSAKVGVGLGTGEHLRITRPEIQ